MKFEWNTMNDGELSCSETPYYCQHILDRELNNIEHTHDFYEYYVFVSGRAQHTINDQQYVNHGGDVVLILPGERHSLTRQTPKIELFCVSVRCDEFQRFIDTYAIGDYIESLDYRYTKLEPAQLHDVCLTFKSCLLCSTFKNIDQIRLVTGVVAQSFLKKRSQKNNSWVSKEFEALNSEYDLARGVDALLDITHLSHAQLCRVVKHHLGITPQQYIKEVRLNYAYERIQGSDRDIGEIALSIGYSSLPHFIMSFKKRFGLSPSEVRKKRRII